MACSLAYFGAVMGYPVTVVCSSKLTEDKARFIEYFSAKLVKIGD
jgi:cysteine synthase